MNRLLAGALAGTLGTYTMTVVAEKLFGKLPSEQQYPLPPREITQDVAERAAGRPIDDDALMTDATVSSHFLFGAAAGTLFTGLGLHRRWPLRSGMLYGLGVWTVSYLGWIPGLGILKPATRHPPERTALMVGTHLVWGLALGLASSRLLASDTLFAEGDRPDMPDRS